MGTRSISCAGNLQSDCRTELPAADYVLSTESSAKKYSFANVVSTLYWSFGRQMLVLPSFPETFLDGTLLVVRFWFDC